MVIQMVKAMFVKIQMVMDLQIGKSCPYIPNPDQKDSDFDGAGGESDASLDATELAIIVHLYLTLINQTLMGTE